MGIKLSSQVSAALQSMQQATPGTQFESTAANGNSSTHAGALETLATKSTTRNSPHPTSPCPTTTSASSISPASATTSSEVTAVSRPGKNTSSALAAPN